MRAILVLISILAINMDANAQRARSDATAAQKPLDPSAGQSTQDKMDLASIKHDMATQVHEEALKTHAEAQKTHLDAVAAFSKNPTNSALITSMSDSAVAMGKAAGKVNQTMENLKVAKTGFAQAVTANRASVTPPVQVTTSDILKRNADNRMNFEKAKLDQAKARQTERVLTEKVEDTQTKAKFGMAMTEMVGQAVGKNLEKAKDSALLGDKASAAAAFGEAQDLLPHRNTAATSAMKALGEAKKAEEDLEMHQALNPKSPAK